MKKVLYTLPEIIYIENFLTHEECDEIIKISEPLLQDSEIGTEKSSVIDKSKRNSKDCSFNSENVLNKIQKEIGFDKKRFEPQTVICYDIGGSYVPHWDYYYPGCEIPKVGGNRVGTVIIYLNDVEEGGNTTFTELNVTVKPKKGSMLYFRYDYESKIDNVNTSHAGEPVIKGKKYILTTWIREFSFYND